MRQSLRTNTGKRRDTLARRWRPWLTDDTAVLREDPPPAGPAVEAEEEHLPTEGSTLGEGSDPA